MWLIGFFCILSTSAFSWSDYYIANSPYFISKIYLVSGFDPVSEKDSAIESIVLKSGPQPADILIGHSMGGLRAFTGFQQIYNHNASWGGNIKGLITVDSPLRGFYGLKNGWAFERVLAIASVTILADGIFHALNANPALLPLLPIPRTSTLLVAILEGFEDNEYVSVILDVLEDTTGENHETILDMAPRSEFLRDYVYDVNENEFPENMASATVKFGFIIGGETDPGETYIGSNTTIDTIRIPCTMIYTEGEIENLLLAAAFAWNPPLFIYYTVAASKCHDAASWCSVDFDDNFASLLGSNQHDMLVAEESQYLPVQSNRRIIPTQPYIRYSNIDHLESDWNPDIWGVGGQFGTQGPRPGGGLAIFIDALEDEY